MQYHEGIKQLLLGRLQQLLQWQQLWQYQHVKAYFSISSDAHYGIMCAAVWWSHVNKCWLSTKNLVSFFSSIFLIKWECGTTLSSLYSKWNGGHILTKVGKDIPFRKPLISASKWGIFTCWNHIFVTWKRFVTINSA